jgi:TPR repeat protein
MGNAYANGHGVPKDEARAAKFYEGGAQAGDPASKFTLGTWLYRGRGGLAVDKKRSFQLQLEAAEAGHPGAMFNTGTAYMEGEAEPQDFHKAAEWFEKAADKGVAEANVNLGSMYRAGLGVPKDLHKARSIFQRFAAQHEVSAELVKEVELEIAAESKK